MGGFFDSTLALIADRLGVIAPQTLEILNETVTNLKRSKSLEELRVVLETMRTLMRRVTGTLLRRDMLKKEEEPPSESSTVTKATKILDWAVARLEGESKDEAVLMKKATSGYLDRARMIMKFINRPIHEELQSVEKAQVERIVISVIVWIGDMISILDQVGYQWERDDTMTFVS